MTSISSISKNSTPVPSTNSQAIPKSRDKEIQSLIERKSQLNEQIEVVRSNETMDKKLKQERIQALRTSIQETDAQIAQIKAEEMQEKIEKAQPKKEETKKPEANAEVSPETSAVAQSMNVIIKSHTTYDRLGKLVGLNKQMESSIKPIQGEIKLEEDRLSNNPTNDIGRPLMLENAERTVLQSKREHIQEINSSINGINNKIGELVSDLKDNNNEASAIKNGPASLHPTEDKDDKDVKNKSSISKDKDGTDKAQASSSKTEPAAPASPSIDIRV
ncbi:FlxA-like family protein [Paenibacillus sp. BAC0078]